MSQAAVLASAALDKHSGCHRAPRYLQVANETISVSLRYAVCLYVMLFKFMRRRIYC
jgi:hypothetical protein